MSPGTRRVLGLSLWSLGLVVQADAGQSRTAPVSGDGLLRSELSLGGQTVVLAYAPDLRAGAPGHKGLLSASSPSGNAAVRVRLGQLETTGPLRIDRIEIAGRRAEGRAVNGAAASPPGPSGRSGARYDLWPRASRSAWQIDVVDAALAVVGQIQLLRRGASTRSPNFVAALVAETTERGRLMLWWGDYQATTDVEFVDRPRPRLEEDQQGNSIAGRTNDQDTSALSRARLLAQKNETAWAGPNGARLSVSFQRTFARGEGVIGSRVGHGLGADGPDFARLLTPSEGSVVVLTESSVPRLRAETPLRFGRTLVATGNQGAGFPGSYGIWLKHAGSGWQLVFNSEADSWGSPHDPKFDVSEIELFHSEGHSATRPFAVALVPTSSHSGRLLIMWGPHEWTADFTVLPAASGVAPGAVAR